MMTLAEQLTNQFYEWEQYGRGWRVYGEPVDIEPPFHPFFGYIQPQRFVDDGKRPTLLSSFSDWITGNKNKQPMVVAMAEPEERPAFPFVDTQGLQVLQVCLPKGCKAKPEDAVELLVMLTYCTSPISFEIIATPTGITTQFVCRESTVGFVQSQLKAYFPECIIENKSSDDDLLQNGIYGYAVDFGLCEEFMRPIATADQFVVDPFTGLFAIMDSLHGEERAVVQVLFAGTLHEWSGSLLRSVTAFDGKTFFENAPDMMPLTKKKIASPLFAATIRCAAQSPNQARANMLTDQLVHGVVQVSRSESNKLIPLSGYEYSFEDRICDIEFRESHRLGMLLNAEELASFVHLPMSSISHKLSIDTRKTKAIPSIAHGHNCILGLNLHQGIETTASVNAEQRLKHMHIIGATGTGKSTLLLQLILQDIQQRQGVAVLDPHGDLIEHILSCIPLSRLNDVVIIDPADAEFPVGFNILTAHSEIEKEVLSSDLVAAFRQQSTSWGDQMNSVFSNAVLAFLESTEGGTLVDLRRFLVEKSFREKVLTSVSDPNIVYYWTKEYPLLKSSSIGSILTRFDSFLRPKLIRNMMVQKKSIDFEYLLDSNKIVLVKLSQGLIGTENSYLMGSFVVAKIHQAAMARQAKAKEARSNFFFYIDEFQHFITPSMTSILSGARKYHLGLILAHQDMSQLKDSEMVNSVMANVGTRICFRVGDSDAKRFAEGFSYFDAQDLQNLSTGEAIVRMDKPENDFSLTTIPPSTTAISAEAKQAIIDHSRNTYGTPKGDVERMLQDLLHITLEISKPAKKENVVISEPIHSEPVPVVVIQKEIKSPEMQEKALQKKIESQHRYLQTLIKKMAESRGYRATIEAPTKDGQGRVDVLLERNGETIAVEIGITTEADWEAHNIQKCLNNSYSSIISCSPDRNVLTNIRNATKERLTEEQYSKILFLEPDELFLHLDQVQAKESSGETRIKGYRVKVEYDVISEKEMKQKRETVARVVMESMKKLKR